MAFHPKCFGKNINLLNDGKIASRETPRSPKFSHFGHGITFTEKPVQPNEPIIAEILNTNSAFAGALRIGLTNKDPEAICTTPLPSSSLPGLAQKGGTWGLVIPDISCEKGNWVTLKYQESGDVELYVNDDLVEEHKLENKVDCKKPVWAFIDVYGSVTKVGLLLPKKTSEVDLILQSVFTKQVLVEVLKSETVEPFEIGIAIFSDRNDFSRTLVTALQNGSSSNKESDKVQRQAQTSYCFNWSIADRRTEYKKMIEKTAATIISTRLTAERDKIKSRDASSCDQDHACAVFHGDLKSEILKQVKINLLHSEEGVSIDIQSIDLKDGCFGVSLWTFAESLINLGLYKIFLDYCQVHIAVLDLDRARIDEHGCLDKKFLEVLHSYIQTILTCDLRRSDSKFGRMPDSDSPTKQHLSPPIAVVGFYGNADGIEERNKVITSAIRDSLVSTSYQPHILSKIFCIPHEGGHISTDSDEFKSLKECLQNVSVEELKARRRIPMRWFLMGTMIENSIEHSKPHNISAQITQFSSELQIDTSAELTAALRNFGKSGDYQVLSLGPDVYINISNVVEHMSKVMQIGDPNDQWPTHARLWSTLKNEGIMEEQLLDHIWRDILELKEPLLKFMARNDLVYEMSKDAKECRRFVVSTLLPSRVTPYMVSNQDVSFYICYDMLPDGAFFRLCTGLVEWSHQHDGWSEPKLWKDVGVYFINDDHELLVEQCPSTKNMIKIMLRRCLLEGEDESNSVLPDAEIVRMVKDVLDKQLFSTESSFLQKHNPTICVQCTNCKQQMLNLEECLRMEVISCKNGHKLKTKTFQVWFTSTGEGHERKVITEKLLMEIASSLGPEWQKLGISLGFTSQKLYQLRQDHAVSGIANQNFRMLVKWYRSRSSSGISKEDELINALEEEGIWRGDLSQKVKEIKKDTQ